MRLVYFSTKEAYERKRSNVETILEKRLLCVHAADVRSVLICLREPREIRFGVQSTSAHFVDFKVGFAHPPLPMFGPPGGKQAARSGQTRQRRKSLVYRSGLTTIRFSSALMKTQNCRPWRHRSSDPSSDQRSLQIGVHNDRERGHLRTPHGALDTRFTYNFETHGNLEEI